jgi:uncharacterized membrane protein
MTYLDTSAPVKRFVAEKGSPFGVHLIVLWITATSAKGGTMAPPTPTPHPATAPSTGPLHHLRFHAPHAHLVTAFGSDGFGVKAEAFARFFGTPTFLIAQTVIVAIWIGVNVAGATQFDVYPFILLNLAFSLQAAYAAPLILLAQTRQADRDKAHTEADAQHREALAAASEERQALAVKQAGQLLELLQQNTELTRLTQQLSQRIEALTADMHGRIVRSGA